MAHVPPTPQQPEDHDQPARSPVGAAVFLLAVAALYPGLFLLLGSLIVLSTHLALTGAQIGLLVLVLAVVLLGAITWHVPKGLKRFGFPRPRLAWALLFGATVAGVVQLVTIGPLTPFPLPLWLLPYVLVGSVTAVLLWTRGFRTSSRNRWGALILVLLFPVTFVGWGWVAENAEERRVQERLDSGVTRPFTPGVLDSPEWEPTRLREPVGGVWRDGAITEDSTMVVYENRSTDERLETHSMGVASPQEGRMMAGPDCPELEADDPTLDPCVADGGDQAWTLTDRRTLVTLWLEPADPDRLTELTERIRPVTEQEYSVLVSELG